MELEAEGPDTDAVLMQLLQALAQKGRLKRAESVLKPAEEAAPPAEGDDAEMAELEAMMAEEGGESKPEGACETCGKPPGECMC